MVTKSRGIGRGVRRIYQGLSEEERLLERFVRKLTFPPSECWDFQGVTIKGGYQHFKVQNRNVLAHRWAYEYFCQPIPVGLTIDHRCGNEGCANPDHLEAVTIGVNIRRGNGLAGQNARKAHCPRGHPYDSLKDNGHGLARACRTCERARLRKYR